MRHHAALFLFAALVGAAVLFGGERIADHLSGTDHSACAEFTRSLDQYSVGTQPTFPYLNQVQLNWYKAAFEVRNLACR
jgi:hypothetical protein